MAKLPTVVAFGPRPSSRSPRRVIPFRAGIAESAEAAGLHATSAAIGGATTEAARLGRQIADAEERTARAQDRLALTRAKSKHLAADLAIRDSLEDETDYTTFEARYSAAIGEATENIVESFGERTDLAELFVASTADTRTRGLAKVRAAARTKSDDAGRADLFEQIDENKNTYVRSSDPDTRRLTLVATGLAIRSAAAAGYITAEKARELGRETAVGFVEGFIAIQPPAVQMRTTGGDKPAPDFTGDTGTSADLLPPETRERIYRAAERQALADESRALRLQDRAERLAEKALKEARDVRAAELTDGILEGAATDADLDAALADRSINGSQFIAARKLLEAEEKESAVDDDPNTVLEFTQQIEVGTLTADQVIDAYANKLLKRETMDRFRNEIDAGPDDFRTKEERRILVENVGGVSGLGAILGEKATRKVNDARQEFNDRVRGPDKEDPRAVRLDIESRAAEPRTLESLFRPRFMVGETKETMDVRETRKATARALRAGKITPAQAAREIQLIKDIEAARPKQ